MASEVLLNGMSVEECEVVINNEQFGEQVHQASDRCNFQKLKETLDECVRRHMWLFVQKIAGVDLEPVGDEVWEENRSEHEGEAHSLPLVLDGFEAKLEHDKYQRAGCEPRHENIPLSPEEGALSRDESHDIMQHAKDVGCGVEAKEGVRILHCKRPACQDEAKSDISEHIGYVERNGYLRRLFDLALLFSCRHILNIVYNLLN